MNKELACTDVYTTYKDIQEIAFFAASKSFDVLAVLPSFIPLYKTYLENTKAVKLAAIIDYPYGIEPGEVKRFSVLSAINKGADIVDVIVNNNLIFNDNWRELKSECEGCVAICKDKKIDIRFVIDYRAFDKEISLHLCKSLKSYGANAIITTSGFGADDTMDNILFAKDVQKKLKIDTVLCSSMMKSKHIDIISNIENAVSSYRITSFGTAKNIFGAVGV